MKKLGSIFMISVLGGAVTLGAYKLFFEPKSLPPTFSTSQIPLKNVSLGAENVDFTQAAEMAIHSVVHVKNLSNQRIYRDPFEFFFGGQTESREPIAIGAGSGVIISEDGYIITNNHVIQNATEIEVTLNNNKSYKAKLAGTDSKMDIALLKINTEDKLPYMTFGDSEAIKVGEWVLAVGNPYNLTSTVTAGIVSAKARNLSKDGLQSFIQTDAAVNSGNSGGALVNTRGELIGINTMISSPTGSYAGYSFAVPSNLARKIIEDLLQFGNVQRGILGVNGTELNSVTAEKFNIPQTQGFYVGSVTKKSGAEQAGIIKGDIIVQLDDKKINGFSDLTAYVNTKRPDDTINVTVVRNGKEKIIPVKLSKKELVIFEVNGLEFEEVSAQDKKALGISYGVKIKDVTNEEIADYANDLKGSIILSVDNVKATDPEKLTNYLSQKEKQRSHYEIVTKNRKLIRVIF